MISYARNEHRNLAYERAWSAHQVEAWMGDVRDVERLRWAFRAPIDVVIHAAAIKTIEYCQREPDEAHKTNVVGTLNVVSEAIRAGIPKVLVVSSDKACSPETTYGATKRLAEDLALAMNGKRGNQPTTIAAVRYGNVLGSQGSVLDRINEARSSGLMPITSPDCTRFWWSADEAAKFLARVLMHMGAGEIWVPKMASAKIVDLVAAVAPAARLVTVGVRGQEKLHESMIAPTERVWELEDAYVIRPFDGAWWAAPPPEHSRAVPLGFAYTSNDQPEPVRFIPTTV